MGQSYSQIYDWKPELPDIRDVVYKYPKTSVKIPDNLNLQKSFKDHTSNFGSSTATSISSILDSYGLKYTFNQQYDIKSIGECIKNFKIEDENKHILICSKMSNFKNQIKQTLHNRYPIIFGFTIYESFESDNVKQTGIVKLPTETEKILGGLCAVIVGYDKSQDHWIVKHTLGKDFGDNGYIYIPSTMLENSNTVNDFWCISVE